MVGFWAFKDKSRRIRECGLNGTRFRGDAVMDTDKIRIWPWAWEAEAEQRTRSLEEKRARNWEVRMLQNHPCGHSNDQALWEVGLKRGMVSQHLNLQWMKQSDLGWGRWFQQRIPAGTLIWWHKFQNWKISSRQGEPLKYTKQEDDPIRYAFWKYIFLILG